MAKDTGATLVQVQKFFGIKLADFRTEWAALSDKDKAELKEGIGNESLTY